MEDKIMDNREELIGNYVVNMSKNVVVITNTATTDTMVFSWDDYYNIHNKIADYYEELMDI